MKKNTLNFIVDMNILIVFMCLISTGVLLHHFTVGTAAAKVLGLTRFDWGTIHWILSITLFSLIVWHLILHLSWGKANIRKYLKLRPGAAVIGLTVVFLFFGIFAPVYLTREFPSRREIRPVSGQEQPVQPEKNNLKCSVSTKTK
jgi:hypothetical protein